MSSPRHPTEDSDRLLLGRRLAHYRVYDRLGAGGMGVVYRARDERLERDVALKVLPAGVLGDMSARRRFQREAQALAKLHHPHVGSVFAFGEEDGIDYLVMELVEGTPLSERLTSGPLEPAEVTRLGRQLAAGLEAAHSVGVIHRDLKPGNLLVRSDGCLKIVDFGLAKLIEAPDGEPGPDTLTGTAAVVGTLPYMAPEQILGKQVDPRTDLYSAGVVLYEMAVGHRPFAGGKGLIDAILHDDPTPPSRVSGRINPALDAVILRALEKSPEKRFQSAAELSEALGEEASGTSTASFRPSRRSRTTRRVLFAALLLVAAAGAATGIYLGSARAQDIDSVAVLPIRNATNDPQLSFVGDGITEELILRISQIPRLKVIARASVFRYKDKTVDPERVGKELGVRAILTGRLTRMGTRLRLSTELIDTRDRRLLWGSRREAPAGDLRPLQEEIVREVAHRLRPKLGDAQKRRLARRDTRSSQAHRLYLQALTLFSKLSEQSVRRATALLQRALELDPLYALAHAGLALAYYNLSNVYLAPQEAMPRARAAAERALQLDPQLGPAHVILAMVQSMYERRWDEAERSFRRAIALNPGYAVAHHYYGIFLIAKRRFAEAARSFARARELDPLSMSIATTAIWPDYFSGRYEKVLVQARRLQAIDPKFFHAIGIEGRALVELGRYQEALARFRRAIELEDNPYHRASLAWTLALMGRRQEARRRLDDLVRRRKTQHLAAYDVGLIYAALGNLDEAFRWMERSYEARDEELNLVAVDPRAKPLRRDPRYEALLRKLHLLR